MTIWATRSWSESVARVLSTQWRCAPLSGSLGERGPGGVEIAGGPDEVAGAIAPHPVVATVSASAAHTERGVMLEYTIASGLRRFDSSALTSLVMLYLRQRSINFRGAIRKNLSSRDDKVWCAINTVSIESSRRSAHGNRCKPMARSGLNEIRCAIATSIVLGTRSAKRA
jgi:hypothetical protein